MKLYCYNVQDGKICDSIEIKEEEVSLVSKIIEFFTINTVFEESFSIAEDMTIMEVDGKKFCVEHNCQ
jgi:hypothetical protein